MAKQEMKPESVEKQLKEMEAKEESENLRKAQKYNNEDKTIKANIDKFHEGLLNKSDLLKVGLNLETNVMSLTVSNGFIFSVLSEVWGADLEAYKSKYPKALKSVVSDNINNNSELFLN